VARTPQQRGKTCLRRSAHRATGLLERDLTIQPATALLVSSTDLNWVGLRAILAGWPEVHVIDDVQRREHALPIAAWEHPDLVLVASDLAGMQLLPLMRDLRPASPYSRGIVLGKLLEPKAHGQLVEFDVAAFVQRKTVTPSRIQLILATVCKGEMYVGVDGCREDMNVERT